MSSSMMVHVSHTRVNDCLNYLFSKLNHTIDQCSPTKDALEKHILRATLPSYIWSKSTQLKEDYIAVIDRRWDVDERGDVNPLWTTLLKASKASKGVERVERVERLVKPMPFNPLSFADVTVFARTDITSSMIRFVERGTQ